MNDKTESVICPTCSAAPGEKCKLTTGEPRFTSHRDRRAVADDLSDEKRERKPMRD